MRTEQAAPALGIAGCLGVVATLTLPFALYPDRGSALAQYYTGGPLGVGAILGFALVGVVVFLAGIRGRTDPLFGFPASWITELRWIVVAATAVIAAAAGLYARSVLD